MKGELKMDVNDYLPLRDVVFNTLRQAILRGEMEPGERLMEIQLADKLGVSRTPIREAIRKLELEVAKQILAEVFSARSSDVEDMIIRRLEDKREPGAEIQPEDPLQTLERSAIKEKKGPVLWGSWPEMFQV